MNTVRLSTQYEKTYQGDTNEQNILAECADYLDKMSETLMNGNSTNVAA